MQTQEREAPKCALQKRYRFMNKGLLIRLLICIFACGLFLYSYLEKQNRVTALRISIPAMGKEIKHLKEENTRLQYEIDQFENPQHLIELARRGEFSHLKHPLVKEVVHCGQGLALQLSPVDKTGVQPVKAKATFAHS